MNPEDIKVLLVDDEPTQRLILEQRLKAMGVNQIIQAADGTSALVRYHEANGNVDLVITDLVMEPMDGLGLMRSLATEPPEKRPPVAVVSAMDETVERATTSLAKALSYPFMGFIIKPLRAEGLVKILENLDRYRPGPGQHTSDLAKDLEFSIEEVEQGLAKDQFEPYFQPKVDAKSFELVSTEALARWKHPAHGLVSPDCYISLLEREGKIHYLTETIARKSIETVSEFFNHHINTSVSINLSLAQLEQYDIVSRLKQLAAQYRVPHENIYIEVTETAHIRDVATTLETLSRLRLLGFGLSLDDFGTGYSSIQNLDILPINELKIDQSFIADITTNVIHRELVESMISLGKNLGVTVVAEGVETEMQCQLLARMGCDQLQGFFISKALTANDFIASFKHRAA